MIKKETKEITEMKKWESRVGLEKDFNQLIERGSEAAKMKVDVKFLRQSLITI